MALVLLALGSRGDVEPMAALAGALVDAGVETRVVALAEYAPLVDGLGASFVPIEARLPDPVEEVATLTGRLVHAGPTGQAIVLRNWLRRIAPRVVDAVLGGVRPGDPIVTGVLTRELSLLLTREAGARMATVVHTGLLPTVHRQSYQLPQYYSGWAPYDRWGSGFGWVLASTLGGSLARVARRRLGARDPRGRRLVTDLADRYPIVVAASPVLVPPASDWPPMAAQTSHLVGPPAAVDPPAELAAFLGEDEHPRPVYVGFGSMTGSVGSSTLDPVVEAARRTGRRLVTPVLTGMTPGPVDDLVLAVPAVPHDWLFPKVAAVVHHGGAGTTYRGLRSGVPSAGVPFGVDQPYHAGRLTALGVGPAPLPVRRLTGERLAALVAELVDSPRSAGYRSRAAEVGAICRAEDGVGDTVRHLDRLGLLA